MPKRNITRAVFVLLLVLGGAGAGQGTALFAQTGVVPAYVPPPRMQPCTGKLQPPVPILPPQRWIGFDDYPSRSLRNEEEGKVYVTITVGVDGRARDVEVTSSSATPGLEEATIAIIKRRSRFMPALNKCKPVEGEFETSLNWKIPE
jgi:protein TonB